jgi:hypothetical protein
MQPMFNFSDKHLLLHLSAFGRILFTIQMSNNNLLKNYQPRYYSKKPTLYAGQVAYPPLSASLLGGII